MIAEVVDHYRISSIFKSSDCRERCLSVPWEFDLVHGFGMPRAAFPTTEEVKIYFLMVAEVVDRNDKNTSGSRRTVKFIAKAAFL